MLIQIPISHGKYVDNVFVKSRRQNYIIMILFHSISSIFYIFFAINMPFSAKQEIDTMQRYFSKGCGLSCHKEIA